MVLKFLLDMELLVPVVLTLLVLQLQQVLSGSLTGNVTGDATGLSGTPNLVVGIITATTFSGVPAGYSNLQATLFS